MSLVIDLSILGVMIVVLCGDLIHSSRWLNLFGRPIVGSVHVLTPSVEFSLSSFSDMMSSGRGVFVSPNIRVGVKIVKSLVLSSSVSLEVTGVVLSHGIAVVERLVITGPPILGKTRWTQVQIRSGSSANLSIRVILVDLDVFTSMRVFDSTVEIFASVPLVLDTCVALGSLKLLAIGGVLVESWAILEVIRVFLSVGRSSTSVSVLLSEFSGGLTWASVDISGQSSRFV